MCLEGNNRPVLRFIYLILAVGWLLWTVQGVADDKSVDELRDEMDPYIRKVYDNSVRKRSSLNMDELTKGDDPKWYGGNDLGYVAPVALIEDLIANITHDFLGCFSFKVEGVCMKLLLPGVKISYRWPISIVESHRDNQERYLPYMQLNMVQEMPPRMSFFYPYAKEFAAPIAIRHASAQAAMDLNTGAFLPFIPFWGPIKPIWDVKSSNVNLMDIDERNRYVGGKLGDLDQVEYTLLPSALQIAWDIVTNAFPLLKLIPCIASYKAQMPVLSQASILLPLTRDPLLGLFLKKDEDLKKDLESWYKNPKACQEWMMNKKKKNIPYDMFDTSEGFLKALPSPLSPMKDSKLSDYNRMCTENWGGSIPFTTYHQLSDTGIISAGKNFEKALRLSGGIYKSFIKGSSMDGYITSYSLNKKEDRYQLTYPEKWDCKKVGDPGKPFSGGDSFARVKEHGLYSMTHWKRFDCCLGPATAVEILKNLADLI